MKLLLLALGILFVGSSLFAKSYKMLIIDGQDAEPYKSARETMLKTLEKEGFKKGQNLEYDYFAIGNDVKKAEEVLNANLKNNYDVIFVNGTVPTIAAKNVGFNKAAYNFVFACVTDPVGIGVIKDFKSNPTANFTGVSYPVPVESRFKFIKQVFPKAKIFALIYADMPQSHSYKSWVEELLKTKEYKDLKVIFESVPLVTGDEGGRKMADETKKIIKKLDSSVDAFIIPNDQMGVQKFFAQAVFETATKPLVGLNLKDIMEEWGAIATIYPSHESMGEQAAGMIKKIFEGKSIKTIPAEQPKKSGFAFNLKLAKKFGINIPVQLLQLAGQNIVK